MSRLIKKTFCVILSIIMCFSVAVPAFAQNTAAGTDIPLIYVGGQGAQLVVDENGSKRTVYPVNISSDFIENAVKDNLDVFAKAVVTQQWDEFCDVLYNVIAPLYSELKLDENGESPNGVRADWTWNRSWLNGARVNGKYPTQRYCFYYDFRLDPYVVADTLHQYIEDVMAVTGAKKVALSGRCLGACIVAAYLDKYDCEHVSDVILYASALNGATIVSKSFCGELYLDSDSIERFIYDLDISADESIDSLVKAFVSLYNDTYGLDIACWSVNNVFPEIYPKILPRLLKDTFGTFPGYWAMVSDEDYVKAKETVFYGADMEKYSSFINIIDNYHFNVQRKAKKNFKKYIRNGVEIADIVKYGYQTLPVTEDGSVLSDNLCDVFSASMGATTADVNGEFNRYYLKFAAESEKDKYISPDNQIDASTCLLPDRTWFIKNLEHKNFPNVIDNLYDVIINNDGFTVFSDERFPQYLVYENNEGAESLLPMNKENHNTDDKYKVSFFDALGSFFKSLFRIVKTYISQSVEDSKTTEV